MKAILFGLLIACFGYIGAAEALGQDPQEEDVRGAFLTTRPKPAEKSTKTSTNRKPSRRRPKTTVTNPQNTTDVAVTMDARTNDGATGKPKNDTTAKTNNNPAKTAQKIGLGLTLFTRDANGLAVRVDPSHQFYRGDRVRLLLETNADGYLYVFNTTDGGQPVMIYPNPDLDDAGNFIQAHVPVELPSSLAGEERLRWLAFDEHSGTERLYFVVTREPLPQVPIEDDLISYCREKASNCPLRPGPEQWTQIQKELNAPVQVAKTQKFGKAQTATEHEATTRGIGLSKDDPEPSLITLTASSNSGMLATTLDLIHK